MADSSDHPRSFEPQTSQPAPNTAAYEMQHLGMQQAGQPSGQDHPAGDYSARHLQPSLDTNHTALDRDDPDLQATISPSAQRADDSRLGDDLELLRAERFISNQEQDEKKSKRGGRTTSREPEPEDTFNQTIHVPMRVKRKNTDAAFFKVLAFLKKFPRFIRYIVYLLPGAGLLLIPVLFGALVYGPGKKPVGGVELMWFGIWLEIVWCSLWISRMVTSLMPHLFQAMGKFGGSTSPKKWKDIGFQLELHTALFLWMLANIIAFKPTCDGHRAPVPKDEKDSVSDGWIDVVWKVIIAFFVLATLNFVEKILIQWIATAFHERTYATRTENNKADIRQLVHLFEYAKERLENTDSFWQGSNRASASGSQTPMQALQDNARQVWGKVGMVANRVGNDLIGRKGAINHPHKVVSELLRQTSSSHTLARLLYRSLVRPDRDMVFPEDMRAAFNTDEEAEAAFGVFDKDINGDISMEEFELVCNEIHLEKKAIAASLKDLDSVIEKLDKVFLFVIVIIAIIVFISILSGSTAAALGSAGTTVLGLAWMLQATAQEFLQSIIFVFVKHPFDVGDRVTIYGSTGATLQGDDYYVTEISLLYTEFKKLQGHIVQAPNSVLNNLFILNQRRSNGLSDVIPLVMRFGTPNHMIEELKAKMLEFVCQYKRDYQARIITEMATVTDVQSCTMSMVFFHKSNFQNELLRLYRHNRFVTEMMYQMDQIGIQSPQRIVPGGSREHPLYWTSSPPPPVQSQDQGAGPQGPHGDRSHDDGIPAAQAVLHPAPSAASNSSARPKIMEPAMDPTLTDYQDVFENRKEQAQAQRLASIKEKDRLRKRSDSLAQPRSSTSALEPVASNTSASRRLFGASRSKTGQQGEIV